LTKDDPKLGSRLLIGAIAGIVGTMAMTSAMHRLHKKLPPRERYPLTPREIVDQVGAELRAELDSGQAKDVTTAAHFAYGAATGALLGAANVMMGPVTGGLAGMSVWLGSYMGWIPGAGILKPATRHPARRNLLMIGVHVVWGVTTARAMRELVEARATMMRDGPDKDAPG
jgi:uncharacterized membrane protein YagU involved in acid resistance